VATIQKRVDEARRKMVEEVNAGQKLVAVNENVMDYDVPVEACDGDGDNPCPSRWSYFSDYRERLKKTRDLNLLKGSVEEICRHADFWTRRCAQADQEMANSILSCVNTAETCQDPNRQEIDVIMSARNPGKISLYRDAGFKGDFFENDFNEFSQSSAHDPLTFYKFNDIGWKRANDSISSIKVNLHPAWTVRFFEHADEYRPGYQYDVSGRHDYSWIGDVWGKKANDKISAFQLIPIPDIQ
jgi:hypothetical protein